MNKYRFSEAELGFLEKQPVPLGVYQYVDRHVYTLALSRGLRDLFGYPDKETAYRVSNQNPLNNTHPDDVARVGDAVQRFAVEDSEYEVIFRTKSYRGKECHIVHAVGKHVYADTGERLAYVWYTDEGEYTGGDDARMATLNHAFNVALQEEAILKENYYDRLTGLPNMTHFFTLAEDGKAAISARRKNPALLYLDLNGMKGYNDNYSYAEGDKLLKAFARALELAFDYENCCHIGADHFAVLTEEEGLEDRLRGLFREARELNGGNALPIRVGVYLAKIEDVPISSACDRAKMACDMIPKTDSSSYKYYSDEMRNHVKRRQYILSNVDRAIAEGWIQVYYQPIVRAVSGRVCDEEALARWIDPVEGFLSPADFIPTLEDAGLIYRLDLYMLNCVLGHMKRLEQVGLHVVPHSINLSRSDFNACDIVEEIRKRVDEAGIGRDMITIEITESVIGSDFEFMKEQVERFRSLGFPVWMDDFGSGYSSLDVLQSIQFDLIKFDMSFMRKLDEGDSGKIILTELMKMATSLGVDTVCEGVETPSQVRFLQEIGCSKLQGYYYCKPIPFEQVLERYRKGIQIGYENPKESAYFESIGRVNLYDLSVIGNEDEGALHNAFNTLPMAVLEVRGDRAHYVRSSRSYQDFMKRFFEVDINGIVIDFCAKPVGYGPMFRKNVLQCCESGHRAFFDEEMQDGSKVHVFVKRISVNPVAGSAAVVIAVLSVSDPSRGDSYADIARALAADYYNIYVVDLATNRYIEYSSKAGQEELAVERHGEDFFESAKRATMTRIYEGDRVAFLAWFTKESILQALDQQGVFTTTYRLIDTGSPIYVNMKIMRMKQGDSRIIVGISIIDAQMKQKEAYDRIQKERDALARMMALSEDYLSLYIIDPETGHYLEQSASDEYETLGLAKVGDDFFRQSIADAEKAFHPDDVAPFLQAFSREKVLQGIREDKVFKLQYRLMLNGKPRPVNLRIAAYREGSEEKLVAGVRALKKRKRD